MSNEVLYFCYITPLSSILLAFCWTSLEWSRLFDVPPMILQSRTHFWIQHSWSWMNIPILFNKILMLGYVCLTGILFHDQQKMMFAWQNQSHGW